MRIIDVLTRLAAEEESLFRAQLLREDVARLQRVQVLARQTVDIHSFKQAGMRVGWTQGDARTQELSEPLHRLLDLVYRREQNGTDEDLESSIEAAWATLHRVRLARLVGCLATPVPRPEE